MLIPLNEMRSTIFTIWYMSDYATFCDSHWQSTDLSIGNTQNLLINCTLHRL